MNHCGLRKVIDTFLKVGNFKYLGNVLTRDGYCAREIKMRLPLPKE